MTNKRVAGCQFPSKFHRNEFHIPLIISGLMNWICGSHGCGRYGYWYPSIVRVLNALFETLPRVTHLAGGGSKGKKDQRWHVCNLGWQMAGSLLATRKYPNHCHLECVSPLREEYVRGWDGLSVISVRWLGVRTRWAEWLNSPYIFFPLSVLVVFLLTCNLWYTRCCLGAHAIARCLTSSYLLLDGWRHDRGGKSGFHFSISCYGWTHLDTSKSAFSMDCLLHLDLRDLIIISEVQFDYFFFCWYTPSGHKYLMFRTIFCQNFETLTIISMLV